MFLYCWVGLHLLLIMGLGKHRVNKFLALILTWILFFLWSHWTGLGESLNLTSGLICFLIILNIFWDIYLLTDQKKKHIINCPKRGGHRQSFKDLSVE